MLIVQFAMLHYQRVHIPSFPFISRYLLLKSPKTLAIHRSRNRRPSQRFPDRPVAWWHLGTSLPVMAPIRSLNSANSMAYGRDIMIYHWIGIMLGYN